MPPAGSRNLSGAAHLYWRFPKLLMLTKLVSLNKLPSAGCTDKHNRETASCALQVGHSVACMLLQARSWCAWPERLCLLRTSWLTAWPKCAV